MQNSGSPLTVPFSGDPAASDTHFWTGYPPQVNIPICPLLKRPTFVCLLKPRWPPLQASQDPPLGFWSSGWPQRALSLCQAHKEGGNGTRAGSSAWRPTRGTWSSCHPTVNLHARSANLLRIPQSFWPLLSCVPCSLPRPPPKCLLFLGAPSACQPLPSPLVLVLDFKLGQILTN